MFVCIGILKNWINEQPEPISKTIYEILLGNGSIVRMSGRKLIEAYKQNNMQVENLSLSDNKVEVIGEISDPFTSLDSIFTELHEAGKIGKLSNGTIEIVENENFDQLLLDMGSLESRAKVIGAEAYYSEPNKCIVIITNRDLRVISKGFRYLNSNTLNPLGFLSNYNVYAWSGFTGLHFDIVSFVNIRTLHDIDFTSLFENIDANMLNIKDLDFSNVQYMGEMFRHTKIKHVISEKFNVSSVDCLESLRKLFWDSKIENVEKLLKPIKSKFNNGEAVDTIGLWDNNLDKWNSI